MFKSKSLILEWRLNWELRGKSMNINLILSQTNLFCFFTEIIRRYYHPLIHPCIFKTKGWKEGSKNVNYTRTQNFINTFSYSLALTKCVPIHDLDWLVKTSSVQTFKPIILIYRICDLVYHHCGCTWTSPPFTCSFILRAKD